MESLGQIIQSALKDFGIEKSVKRASVVSLWPEVVGPQIAELSTAKVITNGKLFVHVTNDAWRHELMYLKYEIIELEKERHGTPIALYEALKMLYKKQ